MKKKLKKQVLSTAVAVALSASLIPTGALTLSIEAQAGEDTDNKVEAYNNGNSSLDVRKIAAYDSEQQDPDGGVMEIISYNSVTGFAYAVNGKSGYLTAIPIKDIEAGDAIYSLDGTDIDVKALVESGTNNFTYGDMTSVSVSPDGTLLAVAVQAEGYADNGRIVIFKCNTDGTLEFEDSVEAGVQPDMVTFTPDGSKILSANEGEPREGYGEGTEDPLGTVTVLTINDGSISSAETLDFTAYDEEGKRAELVDAGIVLKKESKPSEDLEPEYIAVTNTTAYVALQEANAIAVLDLETLNYTGIYSVGFEDYSKVAVDIDKKDEAYSSATYEDLLGIRMPDGISVYTVDGQDYIITANEGDSREWGEYLNEVEVNFGKTEKTSPTGKITAENSTLTGKVVFFDATDYDGLDEEKDYLFGGRSFTILKVTEDGLTEIYTSGSDFESRTSEYLTDYFNCSNDSVDVDDRSGKKGPEPETVTEGTIGNKTYAFVALERIGGIMIYDVTDVDNVSFVNYVNTRDFSDEIAGDVSPEGLCFIPAGKNDLGKNLLLAACEVSGTVAVYELIDNDSEDENNVDEDENDADEDENDADEDENNVDEDENNVDEDENNVDEDANDVDEDEKDVDLEEETTGGEAEEETTGGEAEKETTGGEAEETSGKTEEVAESVDWNSVKAEADKASEGQTITVDMKNETKISGGVIDTIKDKDITVVFQLENGITWSINGKSITGTNIKDIDFGVTVGSNDIPEEIVNELAGNNANKLLSLAHDGEFGFTATLSVNVGKENASLYANLFYYNEATGKMEFVYSNKVDENGNAQLLFTHASDYVIVMSETSMDNITNGGDAASYAWVLLLMAIAGGFVIAANRRRKNSL